MNTEVYKQIFELKTENQNKTNEINEIKSINKKLINTLTILNNKYNQLELKFENYKKNKKERIEKAVKEAEIKKDKEYQEIINSLETKIKNLESLLNINSTNSGIPTSKEKIGRHTWC